MQYTYFISPITTFLYSRVYAIHDIARSLGKKKCKALIFFYNFTGSDITGFFRNVGKKKAWEAWGVMPEMTAVFARLGSRGIDSEISARDFRLLQRFVCVMYRRTSPHEKVNEARHAMFADGVSIENIPPTEGALLQKCKRAVLASIPWHSACDKEPPKPDAAAFGWKKENGRWMPHWSDLPIVMNAIKELISCGCKKKCVGKCKCLQFPGLDCTPACACYHGGCSRKQND